MLKKKPWKHVANVAKIVCALQIPVGFWLARLAGVQIDPWALAQVSLWTYCFFAPIDAGQLVALIKSVKEKGE